eukprot:scaffold1728_cov77-Skeletonema_dohrnii-CCMP3373.AAC.1
MMANYNGCSLGHLRRCSDADTTNKCLSRVKDASILSRTTIMCHYKQMIVVFTSSDTIWCYRVELAAVLNWDSSGHLRRCSDADTTNKCLSRVKDASILSWPTIMGQVKQMIVVFTSSDTIWC